MSVGGPGGERGIAARLALVVGFLAIGAVAVAIGMNVIPGLAGDDGDSPIAISQQGAPAPTETPLPLTTPTPTPPPEANPDAPTIESDVHSFVEQYGYPDNASVAAVRIPALGVDAQASPSVATRGEPMAEPVGPAHVLWYDLSAFDGLGGAPGGGGNAIFSGHVDYDAYIPYAGVSYRGEAVFRGLDQLGAGDIIEIDYQGGTLRYQVSWQQSFSAAPGATNWTEIWRGTPGVDEITLYTCGGVFDPATLTYADRVVVRAQRI